MDTKDIILKISGKTLSTKPKKEDGDPLGDTEFTTIGKLSSRGGLTYISYEESELTGFEGCTSSLTISEGKVKMKRSGGPLVTDSIMEFEKGLRHDGIYETPFGPIAMEILTSNVSDWKTIGDGTERLTIEYNISLRGLLEASKELYIDVTGRN